MISAFSGRSVNGLTLRRLARLRFVSLLAIAQIAFLPFLSYDLRAQPITANQIVTDGRTATSVQTSGNVTSVTTSTVSGANAFNSFSQFGVGQGNTVNLYTPNGAQNLINIVRDAPAYVNGTLNSYANGKIGGNVYFADPYGFVVGKSGTVNVGSLNVSTPSKEFTEGIIGPQGQINGGAVSNLMNGSFPISPDGNIRILGRINAEDGVRLTGQNVVIGGAGMNQRERVNADHAVKFAASVNSKGLHSASAISVRNGSIHIGAVNNATISGRLSARSRTTTPSTITVDAGKNITLGKTASLSTAGKTGDAGNITLKTQGDLAVKSGARIDASSAKGNGGIVDLSADGKFDIGDKVQINLAAPNGTHGTLVLDPVDIVIGGPGDANVNMSNTTVAAAIAALNGTGTFTLSASNSITIDPNGRVAGGTTVSVTLSAPTLTLLAGSYLRGDTVALDSGVSGTININAAANGGAQVLANTALQFTAAHLVLTSTATAFVGDGTTSTNKNAAGFISNATIARYAIAMDGAGDLTVNAVSSITVDATGVLDTRQISGGLSTASSLDVTLKAPAISVLSGGQILTKAINDSDSTFTTGDITLDATGSPSGTVSVAGKLDGGVTTLQAGSSVTLAATGIIDTGIRDGDGIATTNAQNVSLIAPTINAAQGSQILAGAVNADNTTTFIGGNVRFDATSISTGTANAFGTIVGANVDLWAGATVNVGAQARIGSSLPSGTAAITLQAPNILVATGALFTAPAVNDGDPVSGAAVKYNLQAALAINSPSSNTIVQQYIAALNGSGSMTLSSTVSLAVGSLGTVNGGNLDVTLNAPSITLSGGSSVSGHTVKLLAGNDLNIDASRTGGAQISSATALQLAAVTLNLTNSAANVVVGDVALDAGVNLTNSTIANYLAAGPVQNFKISGSSSITVDAAGVIDVRHQTAGLTTGTSANIVLAAPTITIAAGAIVRADVVNIPVQDPAITDPQVPPPTFYTAGDITLTSSNITVGAGTLNGGVVTFNDGQSAIYVGPSNDPNAANSGFLSNAKIASYLASLGGTSTFGLSASSTISIDNGAIIAGGTIRNLSFIAPTLTFAANSSVSGYGIILNAGAAGVININAASNGGAQIAAQTPLQVTASRIDLTSAAAMIVGNASTSTSTAAAGFVSNTTIANYVTALHGIGTLQLSAANSITVDGTGVVDGTKMTSNLSTGNSVNLLLTAPSITVAALGKVVALAVNTASTHYSSGSVTLNAAGSGSGLVSVAGTVKGGIVLLNSNLITVANGATLSAGAHGTVIFAFDEDLTVNSTSGSNGTGGILSNNVVATYVAAMSAGTFALSAGTHNLTLAANAIITAGNGIAVGLSGNTINVVTGATINAVTVGFGFNQDNVVIAASDPHIADTGFVSNSQIAALVLASANATTLTISANNSITVSATGVIDTRFLNAQLHSTHNALNVELDAPIITIATGGQILAKAINSSTSWTDGNVTLSAVSSTSILAGLASSTTSITVDGTITGGNISIAANSTASSNFTSSVGGDLASVAEVIGSLVLGVNAGYVAGESHANVAINSHANISGSGNISITATGSETAADPVVALGIISPVGATAVVGSVKARISATVASGATIAAGGSLAIGAKNDTTLDISALTLTTAASFVTAVAVGMADIQTQAIVNSGAHISAGAGGVSVTARNTNEFSVSATAFAYSPAVGSGGVGGAVAYSTINTVATALLGADVGSSGALSAGPVQVAASSDTSKNAVSSSVTLGQPNLIGGIVTFIASKGEAIGDLVGFLLRPLVTIEFPLKTAGSLSLVISNQSANAGIAATGGGTTPAIYTAGDVSVVTTLIDDQIRDNSASSVTVGNPSTPEAATIAAAVAYGSYTHNSNAYVGQNVIITASRIGVSADTRLPNTNTWGQWDGLSETLSHLNANLGAVNNVVTTYADATASGGTKASVSGSFAYFGNTDNTTAWVGSGATLSSTRSTPGSWSSVVTYSDSSTLTVNFASDIAVAATATNNSINIGGVFGPLLLPGSDSGGLAAGGSLNLIISSSNTIAGVSNGATLTAKDVAVTATTTDLMFAIAPSSGSSSGSVALNGLTSLAFINNETHASISSGATVTAPTINVDAYQNISVLSLAGAIQISTTSGVGLALAYLQVDTDTSAFIGDNHTDIATFAGDDAGAQSAVNGVITSSALSVIAASVGRLTVASVAVVESDPFAEVGAASKAKAVIAGSTGVFGTSPTSLLNRAAAAAAQKSGKPPSFSIDIAGSSAVSQTGVDTSAYISGVTINPSNPYAFGTAPFVQVQALNSSIMDNGSGAAALNLAGSDKPSAAVSGAISVAISQNTTTAYISNTTISDEANATVMALNGGSQSVVAIGIAVTKSGLAGTIAASVALIADSATAYIDNSHVTGVAGGSSNALNVNAYQTSNIQIGGGSLYVSGGSASIGLSLTYAEIRDPGGSKAVDAHITNSQINAFNSLTVIGDDAAVIAAGAASGGLGGNGLAGAIVIDTISPTITAYISSSTITMSAGGTITVTADSVDAPNLDTALSNVTNNGHTVVSECGPSTARQACTDFSGAALNGGTGSGPGAAITSVAGLIQAGKNNVGVAMVVDDISTSHSAYIAQSTVIAGGDVSVIAEDSSKIQSVTIGFGLATGKFAGLGGVTVATIKNNVTASIGGGNSTPANTSVSGRNVSVQATDHSTIINTAAIAGASTQGNAVGLAIVYSEIDNQLNASVTAATIAATRDVMVSASSVGSISAVAVGIAVAGGSFSLAGSVATSILGTNVSAYIAGGADVMATNNIGVIASNSDTVAVFAGAFSITKGAAGGAGSLTTSKITGSTSAYISGAGTQVDALGTSSSDTLSVNSGTLAHALDLGSFNAPTDTTPDLSETQDAVRGLAVVASSHQAIVANVASLAASTGVSIMVNAVVNVMSGSTNAYIDGASIDTRLTSTTLPPQIDVAASSFSYAGTFGLGIVAPTGTAGGGATIISTTMSRGTFAGITNSTVGGAVGTSPTVAAVTVKANAEQDASSIAIGFGSASVGLNVFQATTEAYVDGGSLTGTSLTVTAKDSTGIASANGSGAYGSSAAIGAAFLVQVSANRTEAYVGDEFHYQGNGAQHSTTVSLTGALDIEATTIDRFQAYSVGAALATGSLAGAGMANIEIANNVTIAGIYDTTVAAPASASGVAGPAGAITVNATEDVAIKEIAGALAIATGGVGVGAAANVLVFKSQTTAETRNSDLKSSGVVDVEASSTKEVLSYAVTAGIGSSVGIGAAVGVIIVGSNTADPDTQGQETGQLNGTLGSVNQGTNANHNSGVVANGTAGNPSNAGASSTYDVSTVLTGGNDGVTAQIAGGHVTATEVSVGATSANATKMFLLGAGFGKDVGVGAGIGYTNVSSSVLANLNAIVVAPSVSVMAAVQDATTGPYAGKTIDSQAVAGGLALYFGADAAVAVGNVTNSVTAELGGSVTGSGGAGVVVGALDSSTQSVSAGGGSGGIAAVGASVAITGKSSTVTAKLLSGTSGADGTTINASTLQVGAAEAGALSASSVAVGGGIVSGQASAATAKEHSTVLAEIGDYASITTSASGVGTLVSASSTPNVSADAKGFIVAAGALGLSIAIGDASVTVTADVGDNSTFTGGALGVTAMQLVPTGGYNVQANAIAAVGAALIGLQGSYAGASDGSTVKAYGGTGITLPGGDVLISAENDSKQYSKASGIAAGYIGVGATVAQSTSDADTEAWLGAGAVTDASRLGILQIAASGTDSNISFAQAGSGGVVAGAAAAGLTQADATTLATLKGNTTTDTLYTGGLNVQAKHVTNYNGTGDAFQASVAGASGGNSTNKVTSTTTVEIGTNLIINSAGGDMLVIANDVVNQTGGGARAGSGGVFAGAATVSNSTITQTVDTKIDSGTILSLNDDPDGSTAKLRVEAFNTVSTSDSVNMTTGGLFAGGGAASNLTATATVTVTIDATELFSAGALYIGTASTMASSNNANANLYGVVTGAGASSDSTLTSTQAVNVSGNTTIEAWGALGIYAGQAGDGSVFSNLTASATTIVYNYALVPATGVFTGTASAKDDATLTLASGSQVLGATNVSVGATRGFVSAAGTGTNYNPYLSAFSTANHDNHSHPDGSAAAHLNGVIAAGIYNNETITIALGATSPTLTTTSPYALSLEQVADPNHFNPVVSYNHQKIQYTVINGFNPYQEIVNQLATLSGQTTAAVTTALAVTNPTITVAAGTDPTGDKQRQVDTLIKQAAFAANASGAAVELGNIMVSAGNVSILAETIDGTQAAGKPAPSVTAMNTAAINIENKGLNFLALSKLTAGSISGGHVTFTGSANDTSSPGVTYHQDLAGTAPVISVNASYNVIDPNSGLGVDQNGVPLTKTPDIYFNGVVSNVNGLFDISAALGNVVASQSFNAATIQLVAPHGTFTFNGGAGSIFSTNNDVASQWVTTEYRPTDTLTAVEAAATYLGAYGNGGTGGAVIGGDYNYHPYDSYYDFKAGGNHIVSNSVTNYSNASQIFTARLLNLADADGKTVYSAIFLPTGYTNNNDSLGNGGIATNNVAALAQAEGTTTNKISTSPWETRDFQGQAYSGSDSGPFNCNSCGTFFQVVNIQNEVITPKTAASPLSSPAQLTVHADKALLLSASVLNINGTISSGSSSNYSVNLDSSLLTTINSLKAGTLANTSLASVTAQAQQGKYFDLSPYLSALNTGDTKVGARYDVLTNQIILNSVVQGSGGYVYLNGKIISTSTAADGSSQGNIVVSGGAGTITVNNSTGLALVTNTINTGVSAASVVEIVDQLKQQTTWYVYNAAGPAGQQVATYQVNNTNTSGYTASMLQGNSGPSGLTYNPAANQYLQWVESATLTRPVTNNPAAYGWTFNNPNDPWGDPVQSLVANVKTVVNGVATSNNQTTNFQEVVTATGISHNNNVATGSKCCGTDISGGTWVQEIYDSLTLTLTNTVKASYGIGIQFNGGGTSSVSVNSNASIVIDGSINNLQGVTTVQTSGANSSITVGATANNPLISGTSVFLNAPGGIGSLAGIAKKPVPVQVYGGALTALSDQTDIAIAATGALRINQVSTNALHPQAEPQGNVFLSATGDINSSSTSNPIAPVVTGNSIEINSTGGAIGATSALSGGVSVLNNINPLVIEAIGTTQLDGSVIGGVVNSASSTGTYLMQSTGDLRLGTVTSNGPVFLAAAASDNNPANIVNGLSNGGLTATQAAHLQTVWNDLSLLTGSATVAVTSYQSMVNAAYTDYWQLRNLAFTDGTHYAITPLGVTVLTAQLAGKGVDVAHTDPTVLQGLIQIEATQRFERAQYLLGIKTATQLADSLTTLFGANLAGNAYLQAAPTTTALTTALTGYDKNFSYVLSTATTLYSQITSGSQWTHDQLTYTVSADANPANNVLPPSISDIGVAINVSGRDVMLYAPKGSIGKLAAPDPFTFTSVDSSSLSATQKGLLASAGPGQLTVSSTTDPVTHIVTYTVNVKQENLVILNPLASVAANAVGDVYLGSKTDLVLGGNANALLSAMTGGPASGVQTVAGNVKLDAVGNILAGVAGQTVISGDINRLTLIAETGSIGQAPAAGTDPFANPNALRISLSNPTVDRLDQAIGGQGIYLKQTSGDLILGNITSSGAIQFAATGSIYEEPQFTLQSVVHIAGASLDLRAGGDIGFNDTTLQPLQVQISGAVTGSAVGNVSILSPASDLNVGASGTYGALTAGGTLTLNAAVTASLAFTKLNINADITSAGAMNLIAKGAVTFGAGTSANPVVAESTNGAVTLSAASLSMGAYSAIDAAGVITIATVGDATFGQLKSTASYVAAGNAASIVVSAGGVTSGAILGNGDGQTNFIASGTAARIALSASSIGTSSERLSLTAPFLTATASNGDIHLGALASLEASLLSAVNGNVDLRGSGDLTLDSVLAGTGTGASGTFTAATNGGSITIGTAASSGSQSIHASQNLTFNALTASGDAGGDAGNINVTADNGFILAQTVTTGGVTTLGSVAANGSATLAAGSTITGNTLAATTGAGSLTSQGLISWNMLNVATTLGATSNLDSIVFKTATSGGAQTLQVHDNVTFNALTATGTTGDITVNATNGFILAQTVTAGGVTTQGSVTANRSASLTAGSTITGNTLTGATGAGSLTAQGLISWNTLDLGTTLGATSNLDSIVFTTATSGGAQTLQAHDNVTFNALTATGITGDITVNATNGFILAQTVAANRSASLTAGSTITGNTLAATTGSGALTASGLVNWNTLDVAKALGVTSTASSIALGSAHSGGSQTLQARQNVTFNQITTDDTATDAGDVGINAATGALTGGSINAHGSASLVAATSNTGHNLTTVTGAAFLQGQVVKWDNLTIAGSLGITATTGGITLGTAISGGTQTLHAVDDIVFSQLTTNGIAGDAGDVNLRSDNGSILGGSVFANGDVHFNTGKSLALDQLRGNSIALSAPGEITIKSVSVVRELDLAADTINVTGRQIRSNPSIPLIMNVTGYNGGIATSANLVIDPDAIIVNQFRVIDANFVTDAPQVTIVNGLVPGQLMLTTLNERILLDNRSPAPSNWATLQLYQPGGAFTMIQNFNANFTDAYVVFYTGDVSSTVSTYSASHACCNVFSGSMAIRDIANDSAGTDTINSWLAQKTGAETFYRLGIAGDARLRALQSPNPVETIGPGPAVNIEGLTELRKLRQLQREGQKAGKPGWRSTGLDDNARRSVERFASAQ